MITTKWPLLLVVGESITEEQANEVIVRTSPPWRFFSNDDDWHKAVGAVYGLTGDKFGQYETPGEKAAMKRLGIVDLHYLDLSDRVMSCNVLGPHGWCDWDGTVAASTYNIGKWPSCDEVTDDLTLIAKAFPFLRMRVQVADCLNEGDCLKDDYVPEFEVAGEWEVADGLAVAQSAPGPMVASPVELDEDGLLHRFNDPHGERGVHLDRLRAAVEQVEASRA